MQEKNPIGSTLRCMLCTSMFISESAPCNTCVYSTRVSLAWLCILSHAIKDLCPLSKNYFTLSQTRSAIIQAFFSK